MSDFFHIFQLSVKKALDAIVEKNFSLLPEPYNIEVVACDEEIPDPLENMSKTAGPAVALGEGTIIKKLKRFERNFLIKV